MKKITLSLSLLILSLPCIAQNNFNMKTFSAKSAIATKVESFRSKPGKEKVHLLSAKAQSVSTAIMMPRQEEEWEYEGEFVKSGDYFYEYDIKGNVTKNSYDDGFAVTATDYTYNDNNQVILSIETCSEEGEPFENSLKREKVYDNKVVNVITESKSYTWEETDWSLVSDGYTYRRVINRNDKGAITGVEIYTYFMGEYHLQHRSTITYNGDGLAETWKFEELGYTSTGELVMKEVYTLKNMIWYTTDGQILVLDDLTDFFIGDRNKLQKADVYSGDELTGYINASYEENGDYTYKYTYITEPYAEEIYTHTIIDENGSYTESEVAYEDMNEDGTVTEDELVMDVLLTVTKDRYGRVVEENALEDEEILFAAKYDFTYKEEYGGYPVEQVYSEYDFEAEAYVPFLKIVAKDFYDVVTSIDEIGEEDNKEEYYNLQGVKVLNPKRGIFVKKQGAKISKVVL